VLGAEEFKTSRLQIKKTKERMRKKMKKKEWVGSESLPYLPT
jgi:hypothetical protein